MENYEFIFTEKRPNKYITVFEDYKPKTETEIEEPIEDIESEDDGVNDTGAESKESPIASTEDDSEEEFNPFSHVNKAVYNDKSENKNLLHITSGNKKLKFPFLSLPAGYSCPAAADCKSLATRHGQEFKTGKKIQDFGKFRCYSASAEVQYENVREIRWKNYDLLLKCKNDKEKMIHLIEDSLRWSIANNGVFGVFRIHADGDFFTQTYFDAWLEVVKKFPKVNFYAYTKSLPFWIRRINEIPSNLNMIASWGGKFDDLIEKYNLRNAIVVDTIEDAIKLKRKIDIDDSLAYGSHENFALLLHGGQKEGTERAKQVLKNKKIIDAVKK